MSVTPDLQRLVQRLLAGGPPRSESSDSAAPQAVRACEKLRVPLTKLAGDAGFSSLLSRSLALAKRQVPLLRSLKVEADGSLSGFNEIQKELDAWEATRHWEEILLCELLGLLVTFIGEPLTLSLVREAWPDASLETTTLNAEEKP